MPVINPDKDLLAAVAANQFNGVLCYKENIRYNDDSLARHVIGYLRKSDNVPMVNRKDLQQLPASWFGILCECIF